MLLKLQEVRSVISRWRGQGTSFMCPGRGGRLLDIGGRGGRPQILKVLIRWKNRLNGGKMVHISQRLARFRRKPREFS